MSVPYSADDLFMLLSKHINYNTTTYANSKECLFSYNYKGNCKDIEQIRYFTNLLLGLAQDHPTLIVRKLQIQEALERFATVAVGPIDDALGIKVYVRSLGRLGYSCMEDLNTLEQSG